MDTLFQPCEAIVTIEYENGMVFTGRALTTELTVSRDLIDVTTHDDDIRQFIPDLQTWSLEMRGVDALTMSQQEVREKTQVATWQCPYCGQINEMELLSCGLGRWDGCGALRPLLYSGDILR